MSSYKLTTKSIGKINPESFKKNWMLWLFFLTAMLVTIVTKSEQILIFIGAGVFYMVFKAPPKWMNKKLIRSHCTFRSWVLAIPNVNSH